MNKYLALQKDVFDIDKITVVGSPTITSDGVASGFSSNDYVRTPALNFTQPFNLDFEFNTNTLNQEQYLLVSTSAYLWVFVTQNNTLFISLGTTSFGRDIVNYIYNDILANTDYKVSIKFNGATYEVFVNGNKVYQNNTTTTIPNSSVTIDIGKEGSPNYLRGTFNLVEFKYTSAQSSYSPTKPTYLLERRKEGYDPSKFTIVGSPTITDDGVASGFSTSNYITLPSKLPTSNTFKVTGRFNCTNINAGTTQWIFAEGIKSGVWKVFGIALGIGRNGDFVCLLGNGSDQQTLRQQINSNTWYKFEFIDNGSEYISRLYEGGANYTEQKITKTITRGEVRRPTIGVYETQDSEIYDPFRGSIDLPSFSITFDDQEVFTGAKEKFYMLRR